MGGTTGAYASQLVERIIKWITASIQPRVPGDLGLNPRSLSPLLRIAPKRSSAIRFDPARTWVQPSLIVGPASRRVASPRQRRQNRSEEKHNRVSRASGR